MNGTKILRAVVAFATSILINQQAEASIQFCFDFETSYDDNGYGEDHYTTDTGRDLTGVRYNVSKSSVPLADGYADASGCTTTMNPASDIGWYSIEIKSYGNIKGEYLYAYNKDSAVSVLTTSQYYASGGIKDITFSSTGSVFSRFNVYTAAAWSLNIIGDTTSGEAYVFYVDSTYLSSSYSDNPLPNVKISTTDGSDEAKYVISHEMGHMYQDHLKDISIDCSFDEGGSCASDGHGVTTMEYQSCAYFEGYAHFFASFSWNNVGSNYNCVFRHWNPARGTLDCDSNGNTYADRYMEVTCSTPWGGYGVEWDWWRTFWDMRTRSAGAPDWSDMADWITDVTDGIQYDWYEQLDIEANQKGGNLNAAWDEFKDDNGIDHESGL